MDPDTSVLHLATIDLEITTGGPLPDFLIHDGYWLGDATVLKGVVLPGKDASLAHGLLETGASRVYLGEAALLDDKLVSRLAHTYGSDRVGVFIQVARVEVSWSLETESNADFKTVTPSICEPAWEILRLNGERTGALVHWWLAAMFERGASSAIVRVDMKDDVDLNLCATLMEAYGERLWFTPQSSVGNDFTDWAQWGKVTHLAVPFATLDGNADLRKLSIKGEEGIAA